MPRKKNHFQHTKHQHLEDEDGWTHVVKGPSIKMANSNAKAAATEELLRILRPERIGSVEELTKIYHQQKEVLAKHATIIDFRLQLHEMLITHPNAEASHVVCLGLGPISQPYSAHEYSSLKQLIYLEHAIDILRDDHRLAEPLFVYFQDPEFSELDVMFLTSLHYHVIPWPWVGHRETLTEEGWNCGSFSSRQGLLRQETTLPWTDHLPSALYITDKTFLFTPHLEYMTIMEAVHKAMPSIFFGNNMLKRGPDHWGGQWTDPKAGEERCGIPDWRPELDLKLDWKKMLEVMDWIEPQVSSGDDFRWCNDIAFAVRKVPDDWTISLDQREAQLAQQALDAAVRDRQYDKELREQTEVRQKLKDSHARSETNTPES